MVTTFYFDTYALVEIFKSNPGYIRYGKEVGMVLNSLNLMEFAFVLIRENKESHIQMAFNELSKNTIDYDNTILIEAVKMKCKYQKERLSFVDCIGYCLAKRHKVKFLTGDEKFRHKENVEFVK